MITKKPHNPGQGEMFPTQFELFADRVNRQSLPIDAIVSASEIPVSPAINQVLQSVTRGLDKAMS